MTDQALAALTELSDILSTQTLAPQARLDAVAGANSIRDHYRQLGLHPTPDTILATLTGASLQARATAAAGIAMMAAQARNLGLPVGQLPDPTMAKIEEPLSNAMAVIARDVITGRIPPPDAGAIPTTPATERLAHAVATLIGAVDRYDGDLGPLTGDAHLVELLEPLIAAGAAWLTEQELEHEVTQPADEG